MRYAMVTLVTGAAGFIGSETCRALLERGDTVIGIDNLNDYYDPALKQARVDRLAALAGKRFEFERLDFADAEALRSLEQRHGVGAIVHLGAQAGVRYSIDHPDAYVRSNLVGHANMLELARRIETPHFVYASSSSVYGGNQKLPFSVLDRVDHPLNLYAATKRSAELLSESYANLFRIPSTGLRFFTAYGPWGRPDMAMYIFTKALFEGRSFPLFNHGRMKRDFTYIDDIIRGVVSALDHPPADDGAEKPGGSVAPHALYNIGNKRSEVLSRVVELLEQATGRTAIIDSRPMQPGDAPETFADTTFIERDLGFKSTTTIEDGIPRFVDWYRDYHQVN
jgi:UDP-glucuronate 4-epimerase